MNTVSTRGRPTPARVVASLLPVLMVTVVIVLMIGNAALPYQPFEVRRYSITPAPACAGEPIQMTVDRRYTADFDELRLTESWVAVNVPGIPDGTVVITESTYLPPHILRASDRFEIRPSPLLDRAPVVPGLYQVRIEALALGTRWNVLPAEDITHLRTDPVRVINCQGSEP